MHFRHGATPRCLRRLIRCCWSVLQVGDSPRNRANASPPQPRNAWPPMPVTGRPWMLARNKSRHPYSLLAGRGVRGGWIRRDFRDWAAFGPWDVGTCGFPGRCPGLGYGLAPLGAWGTGGGGIGAHGAPSGQAGASPQVSDRRTNPWLSGFCGRARSIVHHQDLGQRHRSLSQRVTQPRQEPRKAARFPVARDHQADVDPRCVGGLIGGTRVDKA